MSARVQIVVGGVSYSFDRVAEGCLYNGCLLLNQDNSYVYLGPVGLMAWAGKDLEVMIPKQNKALGMELPKPRFRWRSEPRKVLELDPEEVKHAEKICCEGMTHPEAKEAVNKEKIEELRRTLRTGIDSLSTKGGTR